MTCYPPPAPEAAYAAALARLGQLRATTGATLAVDHLAGAQRDRATGTPEERAAWRAQRRATNAPTHRDAQEHRAEEHPPTQRQRRLLWCLGYRGPAPRNRAEVAALVAELQAQTPHFPFRFGPILKTRTRGRTMSEDTWHCRRVE